MPESDRVVYLYATAPDEATASSLASALVEEDAAVCVNIIPGVISVYRWRGAIDSARECSVLVKTTAAAAARARDLILKRHPYETPAVVAFAVDPEFSSAEFIRWIAENVRS